MGLTIGIDASRNRSGGAVAHLTGILSAGNPQKHCIHTIHVWAYQSLLKLLPDCAWLVKHNPTELEQDLTQQLIWQATKLSGEVNAAGCQLLFTTDASTLCRFKPMVVMSQDMLSYESGIMRHFGWSIARLRLIAILVLQNWAMKRAMGVIFLTRYAAQVIQKKTGTLSNIAIIPHGLDESFRQPDSLSCWPQNGERPIRCLYVSNTAMYKHQWEVVRAISMLRKHGRTIKLNLVGGGSGRAQKLLNDEIVSSDPDKRFVTAMPFLPHHELPLLLADTDLFVFASSCENLPVTLLEAMASGLPIACSDRGPMPEVLQDGGVYFDPENADSIVTAVERLISEETLRISVAQRAKTLSEQYSWSRCAAETWTFLRKVAEAQKI